LLEGKVMRARHRRFLVTLVATAAVAVATLSGVSPGSAAAYGCPASTSWDNILQRCV
jgi:hypothetical protein